MSYNPLTEKGFELGKKIFYDGRLASDGVVSCGFCHMQENAFTHHGHTFSHGVGDGIGTRNAPPIQNMAFQTQFFGMEQPIISKCYPWHLFQMN